MNHTLATTAFPEPANLVLGLSRASAKEPTRAENVGDGSLFDLAAGALTGGFVFVAALGLGLAVFFLDAATIRYVAVSKKNEMQQA